MNQINHWQEFYKNFNELEPSSFAKSLNYKDKKILDLGCGNGRDSYYFAKNNLVLGFDSAVKNKNSSNVLFFHCDVNEILNCNFHADVIYCRFFLHSIDEETEDKILKYAKDNNCEIAIETRIKGDEPILYTDHNRREIDPELLLRKLSKLGFSFNIESGYGLAKYKEEDPLVLRIIGI